MARHLRTIPRTFSFAVCLPAITACRISLLPMIRIAFVDFNGANDRTDIALPRVDVAVIELVNPSAGRMHRSFRGRSLLWRHNFPRRFVPVRVMPEPGRADGK